MALSFPDFMTFFIRSVQSRNISEICVFKIFALFLKKEKWKFSFPNHILWVAEEIQVWLDQCSQEGHNKTRQGRAI